MGRQHEHVKSRRKRGLCAYEGCPAETGTVYRCEKHAADHAARDLIRKHAIAAAKQQQRREAA